MYSSPIENSDENQPYEKRKARQMVHCSNRELVTDVSPEKGLIIKSYFAVETAIVEYSSIPFLVVLAHVWLIYTCIQHALPSQPLIILQNKLCIYTSY